MKAIVYTQYGAPAVLQVREVAKPVPKDDEILIRVHAAEATKSDCELRRFRFAVKWFWVPLRIAFGISRPRRRILGGYFSGRVEAVGGAVSQFTCGDEVFGPSRMRLGAYAEYVCLPADYTVARKPRNLSFEEAAAVPLGGLNALHFMRRANIQKGEKVAVNGAGGSIGIFGVLIAKAMGAKVTAVDCATKESMLRWIGADDFVDYTREDFVGNGRTYDVIFNMIPRGSYTRCIQALNPGGRYLIGNPRLSDIVRSVFMSRSGDKQSVVAFAGETREDLIALRHMIEKEQIKPVVDKVYPMDQAAEAHRMVESEQRNGSIVIGMGKG